MKLLSITKSDVRAKKYMALFQHDGKTKRVHFGAFGYEDFTTHRDEERKRRYLVRHEKNESWNDPTTPGALSRWILWNKPTLGASLADFKRRFNL